VSDARDVTDATFEQLVIQSDTPVVVDFWAGRNTGTEGLVRRWSFITGRRALAYSLRRFAHTSDSELDAPRRAVDAEARSLIDRHLAGTSPRA